MNCGRADCERFVDCMAGYYDEDDCDDFIPEFDEAPSEEVVYEIGYKPMYCDWCGEQLLPGEVCDCLPPSPRYYHLRWPVAVTAWVSRHRHDFHVRADRRHGLIYIGRLSVTW